MSRYVALVLRLCLAGIACTVWARPSLAAGEPLQPEPGYASWGLAPSSAVLRRQVKLLQAQVSQERETEASLRGHLTRLQEALTAEKIAVADPASVSIRTPVPEDLQTYLLRNQVDSLKASLAEAGLEIAELHATLAEKTTVQTQQPAPDSWIDNIQDTSEVEKQTADLNALKEMLVQKKQIIQDLNTALAGRSDELKAASTALADLRQKQSVGTVAPADEAQRQAYMAGVMVAEKTASRLDGWQQAGVVVSRDLFCAGLSDALSGQIRLKPVVARKARAAFIRAVQQGAARRVAEAQEQLTRLAKGRKPLKSAEGITWYRVRRGKPVLQGQPVLLALTEQVAGGTVVNRVPPVLLRPGDDMPAVVKDGMYLPGEGGEVVAYGLARQVYGDLPLPPGVQPFTVMEYHLTGVADPPGQNNR